MPRKIGIATTNALKFREFKEHFKRYGVESLLLQKTDSPKEKIEELGLIGVLSEQTTLFSLSKEKEIQGFPEDFDSVNHISELVYTILRDGELQQKNIDLRHRERLIILEISIPYQPIVITGMLFLWWIGVA